MFPDVVTTTILVKAQVGKGDVLEAMATLVEMMKISSLRDSLDAFPFNTIIQARFRLDSGWIPVDSVDAGVVGYT